MSQIVPDAWGIYTESSVDSLQNGIVNKSNVNDFYLHTCIWRLVVRDPI